MNKGFKPVDYFLEKQQAEKRELADLQKEAQKVYLMRGSLCDSEGFYQHRKECWSDALQQLFFNTDGIKEITQKQCILDGSLVPKELPNVLFYPKLLTRGTKFQKNIDAFLDENKDLIEKQKLWVQVYFHEVQKRFLRHYLTESKRRVFLETCSIKQPAKIAKQELQVISAQARKGGVEGMQSAIYGKLGYHGENDKPYAPTLEEYKNESSGGNYYIQSILLNLFNYIFFQNKLSIYFIFTNVRDYGEYYDGLRYISLDQGKKILLTENKIKNFDCILLTVEAKKEDKIIYGHAVLFHTCGNKEFFYEDNFGSIEFPWKDFFQLFTTVNYVSSTILLYIYKRKKDSKIISAYPVFRYTKKGFNDTDFFYKTFIDSKEVDFIEESYSFRNKYREKMLLFPYKEQDAVLSMSHFFILEAPFLKQKENLQFPFQPSARLGKNNVYYNLSPSLNDPSSLRPATPAAPSPTQNEPIGIANSPKAKKNFNAFQPNIPAQSASVSTQPLDEDGRTPLMVAAYEGDSVTVQRLIEEGVNLLERSPRDFNFTALHFACTNPNTDTSDVVQHIAFEMQERGMDINTTADGNLTALALATRYAHPNVVKLLCSYADETIVGKDPWDGDTIDPSTICAAQTGGKRYRKTRKQKRSKRNQKRTRKT